MRVRFLRLSLACSLLLLGAAACSSDDSTTATGASTGATGTSSSSSGGSTTSSDSGNSEGGFIDSSSSGAGSTGPVCSEAEMCQSLGDCELGDCIDCTCVFDYGPCPGGTCTCFVPSAAVCVEGGCFCALPCSLEESNPCPIAPSGDAAPVCAAAEIAGTCGLPCAGVDMPGCPDGMTCVARPDDQPAWGDFVCVFA